MSTLLRRGFTLVLLLLAAAFLHPVDTTAQTLPGWAEPSEQRQSRFESRSFDTQENRYQSNRSRRAPQNGINTSFPGATTNCNGNGNCDNGNGGGQGNQSTCTEVGQTEPCEGNKVCAYNPQGNGQLQCRNRGASNIPVDDYLPLLMLAGIAYAALRLRQ